MKKRALFSAGTLLAAYTLVVATAWAMFAPQAQVGGMTLATASYSIKLSTDPSSNPAPESFSDSVSLMGAEEMFPGMVPVSEKIWIMNDSQSGQPLEFYITSVDGGQDWDTLKYAMILNVREFGMGLESGWISLGEIGGDVRWPIPWTQLGPGQRKQIELIYALSDTYFHDPDGDGPLQLADPVGNEVMGKTATGVNLVISGEVNQEL